MEQAQSRLDALRRQLQPDAASRARMEEAPGAQDSSSHPVVIGAAVVDIQVKLYPEDESQDVGNPVCMCDFLSAIKLTACHLLQAHSNVGNVEAGGTVPGTVRQTMGGVGRNIAQALTQLGRSALNSTFIHTLPPPLPRHLPSSHFTCTSIPAPLLVMPQNGITSPQWIWQSLVEFIAVPARRWHIL